MCAAAVVLGGWCEDVSVNTASEGRSRRPARRPNPLQSLHRIAPPTVRSAYMYLSFQSQHLCCSPHQILCQENPLLLLLFPLRPLPPPPLRPPAADLQSRPKPFRPRCLVVVLLALQDPPSLSSLIYFPPRPLVPASRRPQLQFFSFACNSSPLPRP